MAVKKYGHKILYSIDTPGPGGSEAVLLELASSLSPRFSALVALPREGWLSSACSARGIEYVVYKNASPVSVLLYLAKIVISHRVSMIHVHHFDLAPYLCLVSLATRVPVLVTIHGSPDVQRIMDNSPRSLMKRLIVANIAKQIVFVSEYLRNLSLPLFRQSINHAVIYNGTNAKISYESNRNEFRRNLGYNSDNVVIVSVGNIRSTKGYENLVETAAIVLAECSDARFVIVGDTNHIIKIRLDELVKRFEICDKMMFLGYRTDVKEILSSCDIFVLPSISEGFSLSTIEAMAVGLPTVATRSGGPSEIIEHEVTGLLVKSQCPKALAKGILLLIRNPSYALYLAQKRVCFN